MQIRPISLQKQSFFSITKISSNWFYLLFTNENTEYIYKEILAEFRYHIYVANISISIEFFFPGKTA